MVRGRNGGLSILELESLLAERRSALQRLTRQRVETQKKLDAIDRDIAKLGGSEVARTAGGRVRNDVSLVAALEAVLKGKSPMTVSDILKTVLANGYHSASANFRGIVNQTLIKDKRFHAVGRGTYTLK